MSAAFSVEVVDEPDGEHLVAAWGGSKGVEWAVYIELVDWRTGRPYVFTPRAMRRKLARVHRKIAIRVPLDVALAAFDAALGAR